MIKKSIEFNLIPDENKEYNVKMFHNETQVREENIDSPTMKHYLNVSKENFPSYPSIMFSIV